MSDGALEDSPVPQLDVAFATPLTSTSRWVRLRLALANVGDKMLSIAIVTAALIGLLLPPLIFLVSGLWNTVAYISGVWTLWHEITTWRIADMFTTLGAVDTSLRFAVAGVSYFALILSFIVLLAGLLGRRRQRVFLLPGLLLCAPIVVIFIFATTLSFSVLATRFPLAEWTQYPLISFVLLNALVLAALLLDLRPATRRRWLARHIHRREVVVDERDVSSKPLPVIRFGPAQPSLESGSADTIREPTLLPVSMMGTQADDNTDPVASHKLADVIPAIPHVAHDLPETLEGTEVAELAETSVESDAVVGVSTSTL